MVQGPIKNVTREEMAIAIYVMKQEMISASGNVGLV